jgi:hypothetical protein
MSEVLPLLYLHGLSTSDFGPALEQFLLRRKFTGMLGKVLAALGEHIRTGAEIGPDFEVGAA